jgi:UDP-glucose 4-epimerase
MSQRHQWNIAFVTQEDYSLMEGKRVVVTGGAGFIGSHLAEELSVNNDVIVIDNLATGRRENIQSLEDRHAVRFVEGSITDLPLLERLFEGVDYVFHQAALPSVPRSVKDPLASHETNVNGTLKVLLAARDNNVKKVTCASSSSVYGDTPTLPKKEDMTPNPLSPYAVTKLAGEYYCQVVTQIYGLATVCLRYFNVFGPRQNPNSQYAAVIPLFIKRLSEGTPVTIFDDGEQTRDFTFVKDVVKANILAAESDTIGVYNIAGGKRNSINVLARLIMRLIGIDIEPVYQPPRSGDIKHSLADISKARAIGYEPQYSLEDGLRETVRS